MLSEVAGEAEFNRLAQGSAVARLERGTVPKRRRRPTVPVIERARISSALDRSAQAMDQLGGRKSPFTDEIHFTQFQVLMANGREEDAQQHLQSAIDSILSQSHAIQDDDLRTRFLAMYHEILTAPWEKRATSSM